MSFMQRTLAICGLLVLVSLVAAALIARTDFNTVATGGGTTYFVSPQGNDTNSGIVAAAPLASIQRALDLARPGDTVSLAAGAYQQDVRSTRDGREGASITVKGPPTAVLKGAGGARIFEINHDFWTLDGFTIDGLHGDPNVKTSYRDKLLYVQGTQASDGVNGLKLLNMHFQNAGGECVRLRYFAQRNEVAHSTFVGCGVYDFRFADGGKNGEALYIGTAPEQRANGKNPDTAVDQSNNNWVHHNTFDTRGNECVDIKEGSSANIVEYNSCTGQQDPESGGLDARGGGNTFRYNESFGNKGAGIRLGGDTVNDGLDNEVYGNKLHDNASGGIKLVRPRQRLICGNIIQNNKGGNVVGEGNPGFDPTIACGDKVPKDGAQDKTPGSGQSSPPKANPAPKPSTAAAPKASPAQAAAPKASTAAAASSPQSIAATLDTYVNKQSPTKRYIDATSVKVDRTPESWTLLRFELPARSAPRRMLLQLYVQDSSDHGGDAYVVAPSWDRSVTWKTRPQLGAKVAEIGKAGKGKWITVDISGARRTGNVLALAIVPRDEDGVGYRSTEKGAQYAPRLVLE